MKIQQASEQLSLFFTEAAGPEREAAIQSRAIGNDPCQSAPTTPNVVVGDSPKHIPLDVDDCPELVEAADSSQPEDCEWAVFLCRHGRVPMIEDARKPWQYRGWLLYYRLMMEEHPDVGQRWDYWCRTMAAQKLLNNEPIPPIEFRDIADKEVMKSIERWVCLVDR
jgi:hypothetical protein